MGGENMKKSFLLICSLLFISGCSNNDFTLTLNQGGTEYYSYYTLSDNTEIYTNFNFIKINLKDETINLSEALDKSKITMLDIMNKVGYTTDLTMVAL